MPTAKRAPAPTPLENFEHSVRDSANAWNAFVQVNPFDRRRRDVDTQEALIPAGIELARETNKRALLYATNPAGRSVCLGYVDAAGNFTSAIR